MARLALLASLALSLVASSVGSELSNELEQHYEGYPHTTPNGAAQGTGTAAQAAVAQQVANKPQVNSFIPLIFSYTAKKPIPAKRPVFGTPTVPAASIITVEQNAGPGDIPTYLFNGQHPTVPPNNFPSLIPAKNTTGRKMLEESITAVASFANVTNTTYGACLTVPATAPLVPIATNAYTPGFQNYLIALCSNLANTTDPVRAAAATGRKLLAPYTFTPVLKLYGEVKKSSDTGFPVLTYVFDFTSRPVLDLLTKQQPTGAVPPRGLVFASCTLYLPDGAFVTSDPGTCFNTGPVGSNGVVQPVIVKLAAKSFYYGSGYLGPNTGANAGIQVAPIASFSVNFNTPAGLPDSSLVFLASATATVNSVTQVYGVYADASGIYPGGTK